MAHNPKYKYITNFYKLGTLSGRTKSIHLNNVNSSSSYSHLIFVGAHFSDQVEVQVECDETNPGQGTPVCRKTRSHHTALLAHSNTPTIVF